MIRKSVSRLFQPRRVPIPAAEAIEIALQEVRQTHRAPRAYECHARRFAEIFGTRPLDSISVEEVETYKRSRLAAGRKPATVLHELAFLSRVFETGRRRGACQDNPVRVAGWPATPRNARDRILFEDEEKALCEALQPRDWAVVRLAVLTGMRRGEIIGLRPANVCLRTGFIHLEPGQTKSGQSRAIPLHKEAQFILREHGQLRGRWVFFPEARDRDLAGACFYQRFRRACSRAGIHGLTFHGLRHTCATRLVSAGVDLYTVSKILGHASLEMTQRYSHLQPGTLLAAIERLS